MIKFNFATAAALLGVVVIGATSADAQNRRGQVTLQETSMTPPPNSLGGPIRQGSFCWVSTDPRGFGYWRQCAGAQQGEDAYAAARASAETMLGGGGGGDGGGDSGGAGLL